jgi:hypothetical protein
MEKPSNKSLANSLPKNFLALAILLSLAIGGLVGYYSHSCSEISRCDSFQETSFVVGCYTDMAVENRDISYCDRIPGSDYTESCYEKVAKLSLDESICAKLTDDSSRDSCYYKIGVSRKDRAICEKIQMSGLMSDCIKLISPVQAPVANDSGSDNSKNQTAISGSTAVKIDEIPGMNLTVPIAYQCGESICFQLKTPSSNTERINLSKLTYSISGNFTNISYWSVSGSPCINLDYLAPKQNCGARIESFSCREGDAIYVYLDGWLVASKSLDACK